MKKFILIAFSCLALMLTGCKDKEPEFQLDLTGTVVETTKHITTDFKVATRNVVDVYFDTYELTAYPRLIQEKYPEAYKWVKDKALSKIPNGALYEITAKGYIEWYGVKLSVDEHWKNPE